jgi:hypothetical protein
LGGEYAVSERVVAAEERSRESERERERERERVVVVNKTGHSASKV